MRLGRRGIVIAVAALGILGGAFYAFDGRMAFYSALTEDFAGDVIDAPTAQQLVAEGKLMLIDIRRPDEWAKTGVAEGAVPLDMRREDFAEALKALAQGNTSAPIALICARGVRSARTANMLASAGFDNISDVPEGMLGSAAGPGWLARKLPVVTP
jgi:rhodanese-related sulfurtransferase